MRKIMDTVIFETQGPIAYIKLNRPEALNAFNDAMFHDLNAALDRYRDNPELKAAIISGEGKRAFSAGIDLKAYSADLEAGRSRKEPRLSHCCNPDYCGKPIIAAIRGYCIGEGVQLALACDFRVCASDSIFALPEVELGIAITRMCWHCVRIIGMPAAIEFCLLAERKDAAWALAHQLVHRVTQPGEELAAAEKIALRLASLSPAALQATRKALYKALDLNYKEMLDFSLPLVGAVLDTGDARTGTRAFVTKHERQFAAKDSAGS